jgi:hypothetical protein
MGDESHRKRNVLANIFLFGGLAVAVVLGLAMLRRHVVGAHAVWFLLPLFSIAVAKSDWSRTARSEVFRLVYVGATTFSLVMAVTIGPSSLVTDESIERLPLAGDAPHLA